jgi:hypothetical protein
MTSQDQTPFRVYNAGEEVRTLFDRRLPRIEFDAVGFDLDRIALALFSSTYRSPIPLLFGREHARGEALASDIAMTVELVHAMYGINEDDPPLAAAYETPEWYLRGMASFTDREGIPRSAPMHVFLSATEGPLEHAVVQVVCNQDRLKAAD